MLVDLEADHYIKAVVLNRQVEFIGQPEFEVAPLIGGLLMADCGLVAVNANHCVKVW